MTLHALQLIPYNNSLVKLKLNLTTKQFLKEQENNLTDHAHKRTTGTHFWGVYVTHKNSIHIFICCVSSNLASYIASLSAHLTQLRV